MKTAGIICSFMLALLSTIKSGQAAAQAYPTKPIVWIVPFAAGGTTDIVARIVGERLSRELGQSVLVENKAGAGGSVGTLQLKSSAPDGHTIGMATVSTHAVNPACSVKLGYDPIKDFIPVTDLVRTANVLTVTKSFPAANHAQFLADVKANPGKYNFASTGHCSGMHMMGELYKIGTGADIVHVAYRGAGPALNDLVGGQVSIMFDNLPSSISQIESGTIRALAVASEARLQTMPDVPTFAELGLPDVNEPAWYGVVVPTGTPEAIVQRLNQALRNVLQQPDIRARLIAGGAEPVGNTPQEFATEISAELNKMRRLAKERNISFQN